MPSFPRPFRKSPPVSSPVEGAEPHQDQSAHDAESLVDDDRGEWLAYDLNDWAVESRTMLTQLLRADAVVHSWQGATLLVHESLEAAVDALVDEVKEVENAELDPEREHLAFEMSGWSSDVQSQLVERLGEAGVPHGFDEDGDLVVHEEDEANVESVIEDLLARIGDEEREALDGLLLNDLLSAMFGAADRLRRDPFDGAARGAAQAQGERIAGIATPYGFAATQWAALREGSLALVALIESADAEPDDIVTVAGRLRDELQQVI